MAHNSGMALLHAAKSKPRVRMVQSGFRACTASSSQPQGSRRGASQEAWLTKFRWQKHYSACLRMSADVCGCLRHAAPYFACLRTVSAGAAKRCCGIRNRCLRMSADESHCFNNRPILSADVCGGANGFSKVIGWCLRAID